jgi:2-C-methyl-D-erythritol 4-phosphate cytidylyltransferase
VWAIVVGAGAGTRFGRPKQFESLCPERADGERVIDRSRRIAAAACAGVVVVVPAGDVARESRTAGEAIVVGGGPTRQASVANGLAAVPSDADVICVHDAARPLATHALYRRVIDAVVAGADAAVPGVPVADTIKLVGADGAVVGTPPRSSLVAVQTPQAFAAAALRAAHADRELSGDPAITDDAAMIERRSGVVMVVGGEPENRKVTHPDDLEWVRRFVLAEPLAAGIHP